jgi:thiol-disulfide isomerase/thioredoxin
MRLALIISVCIILSFVKVEAAELKSIPLHGSPRALPPITFFDEGGRSLSLEAWRGKVVLLNIWATWCGPCRAEMPTLDRLQGRLGGDRFQVVALSIDRAGAGVVRKFFDEIGINHLRIAIDPSMKSARGLKVFGLPGTVLVGPEGTELGRFIGPAEWDTPDMVSFLETVIAKTQGKGLKP